LEHYYSYRHHQSIIIIVVTVPIRYISLKAAKEIGLIWNSFYTTNLLAFYFLQSKYDTIIER